MAALVQSFPQQAGTTTILQSGPGSASSMISAAQAQGGPQYGPGLSQQRGNNRGMGGMVGPVVYRGSSAPIQPYAFTSTPSLTPSDQWQQARSVRTVSASSIPTMQNVDYNNQPTGRFRYAASASMTNLSTGTSPGLPGGSRDDSTLPASVTRRDTMPPRPLYNSSVSFQPPPSPSTPIRASPERYRRPAPRPADFQGSGSGSGQGMGPQMSNPSMAPSGSGSAYNTYNAVDHKGAMPRNQYPIMSNRPHSFVGTVPGFSADDMQLYRAGSQDEMKRLRRRSMPALDAVDFLKLSYPPVSKQSGEPSRLEQAGLGQNGGIESKPASVSTNDAAVSDQASSAAHARTGSSDSRVSSSRSTSNNSPPSSANSNVAAPIGNLTPVEPSGSSADYAKLVNIPPRSSSFDAATAKHVANPSPLSKPIAMESEGEVAKSPAAASLRPESPPKAAVSRTEESPAVKQLAAINEKGGKTKSKTSRLRRAFSFGSAAEFRKAVNLEDNAESAQPNAPSKLHKDPTPAELYDAEQARIAQRQEEAGIGNSIYSGGKLFTASTDNISISSTASSASIMIRKMGRGMKKGTRSLVGLFRPKSVIGAPAADAKLPESAVVSEASVSMITIEAERDRVNVNADPHSQNGGGTGFPHLERNSIDAANAASAGTERLSSSGTDNSASRKSIVGGEKERAEVLAAVRKGILKYSGGSQSPSPRPADGHGSAFDLPTVPQFTESPISSAPSTPTEESQGHKRTASVALGGEDYFMTALRLRQDTKSTPGTPHSSMKRNATFSPRIVFYDTWPSQEYDRRGEIATCNRLTPMLAQQIKEELNTFKMEMEVHENSKIYTHFF